MKIVVLDSFTLNPGDLSWDSLLQLGDCTLYDRTLPHQVLERAAGAEIILTNKVVLGVEHFSQLPLLRHVGIMATGTNVVDLAAAATHHISVSNVPAYSTMSVAQQVFALLLEITQQVGHHNGRVHEGAWCQSHDFTFRERPLIELDGLTMGIVGYGKIGQAVAHIAHSFGMHVIVHARQTYRFQELMRGDGPVAVELDGLFAMADVVSLHCPLTAETANLVNARRLSMMKRKAILLNSARGGLIDEAALAQALTSGAIAGAGLDVLSTEPPAADNPLLSAPNCVIAPHLGWATLAARQRLFAVLVENIQGYVAGTPKNLVTA